MVMTEELNDKGFQGGGTQKGGKNSDHTIIAKKPVHNQLC